MNERAQMIVADAELFAKNAHDMIGQKRKYTGEPYWHHCERVAYLVSTVSSDENMIAAAWLHDVIEDVVPEEPQLAIELRYIFGDDIYRLVWELTDVSEKSDGNREARKAIDRQHIANASYDAKVVKCADLIDNTSSIAKHDKDFARVYLNEKAKLLEAMITTKQNPIDIEHPLYVLAQASWSNAALHIGKELVQDKLRAMDERQ